MKKLSFSVVFILFCFGLIWWFWPKQQPSVASSRLAAAYPKTKPLPSSASAMATAAPFQQTPAKIADDLRSAAKLQERIESAKELLNASNLDIRFFGQVIDQDDKPIEGVEINGSVQRGYISVPGYISEKSDAFKVLSRENGTFTIEGMKGCILEIKEVGKDGYEPSLMNKWSFVYYDSSPSSIFKPDPNSPVVFRMWKKVGAESLIHAEKFYGIIPDGRVYGIDVMAGKKIEGQGVGDFTVKIQRPADVKWGQHGYDWSFMIEGLDGGIVETSDEFMYRAPERGYQAHYEFSMAANNPQWKETIGKQFYLKSRGGKVYGRMQVEVLSNYQDKAVFSVKYFVNPSGSRNLEYDPSKQAPVQ